MVTVDLNCDLGEGFGAYKIGNDDKILPFVSSVNIACGFHAGDPTVMRQTVEKALKNDVEIGAHPGFPDLIGFGRRVMRVSPEEVYDYVLYQIGALDGFIRAAGARMHHVKPHGALYNMAATDQEIADAIAKAIYHINPDLFLYGLANSKFIQAAEKYELKLVQEAFADRTYQLDGTLTSRTEENALIKNEDIAIEQVLQMVKERNVKAVGGKIINIDAQTICIHGDGERAVQFAERIYRTFRLNNISICAPK
ncbi:5-oxoprolinase subunit PxpA [Bacillus pseudomycoides]|uniref:5-oxoprolinase subunit A n=1 Tax=Bacillus pseudomycoides TaxID=64104 RepID=A0A2B6Q813_9BACI|nr:5-oxoprolinase subunit PxpA [Bacillus pseudomycoides]PDY47234.1 lactam utilization protein LamB [Bacillus pseudomycoides]PEA81232.1 lactam utilization protein LamB [Bacillus pseudomycoides]PED08798.1 lactam utilization protein LamB [Bacillus pseudomycoides]PED73503.1 lactam utilization protein LamB [Bacillus pseudomycoides]PEI47213.1 lactam utilization protein LamB [Bacillus pseudomycoides]